jgi:hypothetical protein
VREKETDSQRERGRERERESERESNYRGPLTPPPSRCDCGACVADTSPLSNWCRTNLSSGGGFCDALWGLRRARGRLSLHSEARDCVRSSPASRQDLDCCCLGAGGAAGCAGAVANASCPRL